MAGLSKAPGIHFYTIYLEPMHTGHLGVYQIFIGSALPTMTLEGIFMEGIPAGIASGIVSWPDWKLNLNISLKSAFVEFDNIIRRRSLHHTV